MTPDHFSGWRMTQDIPANYQRPRRNDQCGRSRAARTLRRRAQELSRLKCDTTEVRCPSCETELAGPSRFCPECGAPIVSGDDSATLTIANPRAKSPNSSSGSSEEWRFRAGRILANRYRILGLIGQGGMGEVYHATDLNSGPGSAA